MIVDDKLVLELESTARLELDATRQLFGYMSATDLELGLHLHFGKEARI